MKQQSILLLFLFATMLSTSLAEDVCPQGMRKLYLDETTAIAAGTARNFIPALNFYEGHGALWYNRKVLIEPRFEVHLKAGIEPVDIVESTVEQVLEGFTIVISSANNNVGSGSAENMGYFGFTKSLIIEFDFNKNTNDPDTSSYSLRWCDTDCSSDDTKAILKGKLTNQRFDATKAMAWDFRLIYVDNVLKVYSGPNEELLTYKIDLQEKLGSYIANVGFTGYMKGNRRELSLFGTFICEDNYDMSQIDGKFYVKEESLDTADYRAGQKINYIFQFKNNKGQVIPHCYKNGIWNYDFSLVVDCTASNYQISVKDEYNIILSMNACENIGEHTIGITEKNHGNGTIKKYKILSGDVATIELIGHDGVIGTVPTQLDQTTQAQMLKYGPVNGDFGLSDDLAIVLDFAVKDKYGNVVDIGETSAEMVDAAQMSLVNNNGAKVTMAKKDDHYQMIINVVNTGTYQIKKNNYMTQSYGFIVRAGGIDARNSYCSLEDYTDAPTLQNGDHVTYICYFKDANGNSISAEDFEATGEYEFSCDVSKTKPTEATYGATKGKKNSNYYCEYVVSSMGDYAFNGYIAKTGTSNKVELSPRVNNFYVLASMGSLSINGAHIYNPNTKIWYDINGFSFVYKTDSNGFLTAIDLADSDGTSWVSSVGLPSDFKFDNFVAELRSPHDQTYSVRLTVKRVELNSRDYIGIYTNGATDSVVKKSSFEYQLRFVWSDKDKTVTMKYKFAEPVTIGTYTTCFHDLEEANTYIDFDTVALKGNGVEVYVGELELRTTDGYLYNYDIGVNNLQGKCFTSGSLNSDVSFKFVKNVVLGTYGVYGSAKNTFSGEIKFYVNGKEVKTVKGKAGSMRACTLEWEKPELFSLKELKGNRDLYFTAASGAYTDGFLDVRFRLFDVDHFLLTEENWETDAGLQIYSHQWGQDKTKYKFGYEGDTYYHFVYTWPEYKDLVEYVFFCREADAALCNWKYVVKFGYYNGGTVSTKYSFYTLLQSKIQVDETAYVEVTLMDTNNILLGKTPNALENARQAVTVTCTTSDGTQAYDFAYDSTTSAYTLRYKRTFPIEGVYEVVAYYKDIALQTTNKYLQVILEKISLDCSQMFIILDNTIQMSETTTQTIQNTIQIPKYKLLTYNSDCNAIVTYDQNTEITCTMTHDKPNGGQDTYTLLVDKQEGQVIFVHDTETQENYKQLVRGDYYLHVTVGDQTKNYKLFLVGTEGSEDASNDPDFDPSKTEFDVIEIWGEAGVTYSVHLTFKTADGLRWNNEGKLNKFTYSNSYGLNDDQLSTIAQRGAQKGKFIININQKVATTGKPGNMLTINYDGKELSSKVSINMKCSSLFELKYVSGLRDGTVVDLPTLVFTPLDKYGNLYTDLFDTTKTDQATIDRLTRGKSLDSVVLGTNNYLTEDKYLNVQYQTQVATTIQVTSDYFEESYTYRIRSGPIDVENSYAELKTSGKLTAGSTHDLMIYPRDEYMNAIDNLTEEDLKKFIVHYEVLGTAESFDFSDKCKLVEGYTSSIDVIERTLVEEEEKSYNMIQCSTPVDSIGNIQFFVDYVEEEVECRSCLIALRANEIKFENLKTVYTNTNTEMKTDVPTVVDVGKLPKWEITFYDTFGNVITDPAMVEKVDLEAELGPTDVKLCVSNSGNKKIINVCPPTNGDDNYNKFYYLTNGDDYTLDLKGPSTISYPIQITGGDNDGSSDPVDLDKTVLDPTSLILTAGEEGTVKMEMRTADNKRKNYWYPNPSESIQIAFTKDADKCKNTVSKGEKPGQYLIKFSCTKKTSANSFAVTVEGQELNQKVNFVIRPGPSYYLEPVNPDLYTISGNRFTFKEPHVNGEQVTFQFKLLDIYKNYLDNEFTETKTSVLSEGYGSDPKYYAIGVDSEIYTFDDLLENYIEKYLDKHTWDITCDTSGNRYYFTYSKIPGDVDPSKSDWTIDKTEYLVKETSTVEVTLRDSYGVNVGTVAGRLEKEKEHLVVKATGDSKVLTYVFDSITNKNTLLYKYTFQNVGEYVVTAEYDSIKIADKAVPITVSYQKFSADKSQLSIQRTEKEEKMFTTTQTNVNNLQEYPSYKFEFYTPDGEKITNYDKSIPITCQMTRDNYVWDLVVTKEDGYVKFAYKDDFRDEFKNLPRGNYPLIVTVDGTPLTYPLYLLGEAGSEDASPSQTYDPLKTFISPLRIDGIAGEQYQIEIEFRAGDGLRWNYEVQLGELTFDNSYGLSNKYLIIDKKLGEKKGQAILTLVQYTATTGKPDNILTFSYEGNKLGQTVAVAMKCNKLAKLEYDSGLRDGTVIDLPTLKFIPYDAYGNLFTDLFDSNLYDEAALQELTVGTSRDKYPLGSNNGVADNKYLTVQYQTTKATTIDVTSPYNPNTYTYKIKNGPIDPEQTYAELLPNDDKTAGTEQEIDIHPKDEYGNDIEDLTPEDVDKFVVYYEEVGTPEKHDISDTCKLDGITIKCKAPVEEAGEIQFHVDYVDDPVRCNDCLITVVPGPIEFLRTTGIYVQTGAQLSTTTPTQVEVSSTPTFELTFHDKYDNVVTDPAVTAKLDTKPYFIDTDIDLCIADKDYHKHVTVCKSDDGENENKWYYLVNGDNYKLKLTRTGEEIKYLIEITGGAKEGSSAPIEKDKINIDPTSLTLTAGVEDKVLLELRTPDEQRRNYWYLNPDNHIKASFDQDQDTCSYHLNQAEKPGQYYIYFRCTKKRDENIVTVTVDDEEVPQKVTLKVIAAGPAKALLFTMDDVQITQPELGSVSVEEQYKLKEILFDEFDNRITEVNIPVNSLGITLNPLVTKRPDSVYSATPVIQTTGEIVITLKSTLAGQHELKGNYFPLEKYTIIFTHGKPYAGNSILYVEKTKIYAGDSDKIYIHPYDQYNNKIDAAEYKDNSPYTVNYLNEGATASTAIKEYTIAEVDGDNVFSYESVFTKAGKVTAHGYIDADEVKCGSCVITVLPGDIDFSKNDYKRLEPSTSAFEDIKNGVIEKNTKHDPIYRIYPKDTYGNAIESIPEETLKTYTAHLKSQKDGVEYYFKLNNEVYTNQPYAEFVKDDQEDGLVYSQLVGGHYDLIFSNGKDEDVVYDIILEGSEGDSDASNKDPDPQKTHLNSFNLKYVAGQKGDMYVELRTEDDLRRNSWDGYDITVESCDKDDKTFKYNTEKAGTLGVFYITVTTQKANTYPKLEECPLTIKVNGEEVENLHPLMEVSPATLYRTEILSDYYKDPKSNAVLKDGTADSNYPFEVKSFDIYNNLCPTVQEIVGIKILLTGDEVKSTSADVEETGYRKYIVTTTKAGVYTVTSNMNPTKGGSYLPNDSIFNIYPGALYRVEAAAVYEQIKAGDKPQIYILGFDKNDNEIPAKDFKDKFNPVFYDSKTQTHDAENSVDEENNLKAIYTSKTPVTIIGYVTVGCDNEMADTSEIKILVVPGDADPTKSILSRQMPSGSIVTYKNGDSFTVNVDELLLLNVTLYDTYGNLISNIPSDANVIDPTMSGNYMVPIEFDVENKQNYFKLDYSNNATHMDNFAHLVSGNYDLDYKVETVLGEAPFHYTIIVNTGKDDSEHGNGPINLDLCVLTPKEVIMTAGVYYPLRLELRTNDGKLYNREINTDDIDVIFDKSESTFKYKIEPAEDLGLYTVSIYSEKKQKNKELNLIIYSADKSERKNAGPVKYRVIPQRLLLKNYTRITNELVSTVSPEDTIEVEFELYDKYDNQFEERNDIVDDSLLTLINNGVIVKDATFKVDERPDSTLGEEYISNYFTATFPVIYPPKEMLVNIIYKDEDSQTNVFLNDLKFEVKVDIDPTQTKVESTNANKIPVGDLLDMRLYTYDHTGICLDDGDQSAMFEIEVTGPLETSGTPDVKTYSVRKVEDPSLSCQNKYEIITKDPDDRYTKTGTYQIKVTGGDETIATFTQICYSTEYDINGFLLKYVDPEFDPDNIPITETIRFIVSGSDEYGNEFTDPLFDDMEMDLTYTDEDGKTVKADWTNSNIYAKEKMESVNGQLQFNVDIHRVGPHQLHLYFKGEEVLTVNWGEPLPIFNVLTGPCRASDNSLFDLTNVDTAQLNRKTNFTFQCQDVYGNKITTGGEHFTSDGTMVVGEVQTDIDTKVVDNDDGTYTVVFTPNYEAEYIIRLLVGDEGEQEKYGQDVKLTINGDPCSKSKEGSVLCPNTGKCVANAINCVLPENECTASYGNTGKPFQCKVNGALTCVKSRNECDCPTGFVKCNGYMQYCVPEGREGDMCPFFLDSTKLCKRLDKNYVMNLDGVCRLEDLKYNHTEPVCPLGKVLCADLSCRDDYSECYVSPNECKPTEVRCADQTCVTSAKLCPSIIYCDEEDQVACPDGTCVDNEMYCDAVPDCSAEVPYLCANLQCADDQSYCPKKVACGDGKMLCSDNICRESCRTEK